MFSETQNQAMTESDQTLKLKLRLTVEGSSIRVVPHKNNDELVCLKSCGCPGHKFLTGRFIEFMNLETKNAWQGSNYFITEVTKESWLKALTKLVQEDVVMEVPKPETIFMAEVPVDSNGDPLPQ